MDRDRARIAFAEILREARQAARGLDPQGGSFREVVLRNHPPSKAGNQESAGLESTSSAAGGGPGAESLTGLIAEMQKLRRAQQEQIEALTGNTTALRQGGGPGVGEAIGRATGGSKGGFLLSPILSGLARLFGGRGSEPPPSLALYSAPPPLHVDGAITAGGRGTVHPVAYDQYGMPRAARAEAMPPITIQVQAIDSRSFLDHSGEIANAVREALLNAHSLGDIVTEL